MHPNVYLRNFWQGEIRPEVFVAMSFTEAGAARFQNVMRPAIESIEVNKTPLSAKRVDLSKTGDSILTEIIDGVAHAELILADVSTIGHDSKTGKPFRNANVMYEVGLALACRQPTEVLLVRDDQDEFLFDVSAIPHMQIDFNDHEQARRALHEELVARLRERKLIYDARLRIAARSLTSDERQILKMFSQYDPSMSFWMRHTGLHALAGQSRLLDKQLIITAGITDKGQAMFRWTRLGHVLAQNLDAFVPEVPIPATENTQEAE